MAVYMYVYACTIETILLCALADPSKRSRGFFMYIGLLIMLVNSIRFGLAVLSH